MSGKLMRDKQDSFGITLTNGVTGLFTQFSDSLHSLAAQNQKTNDVVCTAREVLGQGITQLKQMRAELQASIACKKP